jgi:adenosine deaminase
MKRLADGAPLGWIERAPKVELHLHMEGSIPLGTLWELIQKYGGDPSAPDRNALVNLLQYKDFPHFIDVWVWKNRFIREYEDFRRIGEAVATDLARQRIVYAEAFFSPADFFRHGLETQKIAEALREGLDRCSDSTILLIADLVRDFGPEQAMRTLHELNEVRHLGVIGVGLGGSEKPFPAAPFAGVFEEARRLGFRTTAHAGEADGPESVWQVVRDLRVERIGHGIRAVEDPSLLRLLEARQIALEVCPTSNVCTGVVSSFAEHPVTQLVEAGVPVAINTDDPKMFGISLAEEYGKLRDLLGFPPARLFELMEEAVRFCWAPEGRKASLRTGLREFGEQEGLLDR